jgi:transposase
VAYNFHSVDRDQIFLLPPTLREWLPSGDLVWFLLDVVQEMDLEVFLQGYREDGTGSRAYHPEMMVGLLLYAYCQGLRSSRVIERMCERDAAYRVVAANQRPDHTSIARFRKDFEKELEGVFMEVLKLCREAGLVKVGVVALDGTKIQGNASLATNRTAEGIEKEVKRMMEEAAKVDDEEDKKYGVDKRGDELPEGLDRQEERLKRLKECKERLGKAALEAMKERSEMIAQREKEEKESGQKKRGRKPRSPKEVVDEEAKANMTDPESRIMKTRSGYVQGYNAQVVVTKDQIIVACDVTQEENDQGQLNPMVGQAKGNLKAVGLKAKVGVSLADAGYGRDKNLAWAEGQEEEHLIATQKDWKQKKAMREKPEPRGRMPKGMTATERMERKLLTRRGRKFYKLRSCTVEPVFGQVKYDRGCDKFQRRGLKAGKSEWRLICGAHNLLKLWRSGRPVPSKRAA